MVTVSKIRRREKKGLFLGILVTLALLAFSLFVIGLAVQSPLLFALIGAFVIGPVVGSALGGTPGWRVENGGKTCEVYATKGLKSVLIVDGENMRGLRIDGPVKTTICGLSVEFYHFPGRLGTSLVMEIEGKKYRLS